MTLVIWTDIPPPSRESRLGVCDRLLVAEKEAHQAVRVCQNHTREAGWIFWETNRGESEYDTRSLEGA